MDVTDPKNPVVTQAMIERGLTGAGLRAGRTVVVHSSLSSFGHVEGGAGAVIDALLSVLGPEGTLCMPALTYGPYTPANPPPLFDPGTARTIVGRIPEVFRRRAGALRSLHPTHSVAGVGPAAAALLEGHQASQTPCGPDSPWGKLRDARAGVLMIGCGTDPMTISHGPEEMLQTDARCTAPVRCRIRAGGEIIEVDLRLHNNHYYRPGPDRKDLEAVLGQRGLLQKAKVGNSTLLLTTADAAWDTVAEWCRRHPGRAEKAG